MFLIAPYFPVLIGPGSIVVCCVLLILAQAPSSGEKEAVRQAVLDYGERVYNGSIPSISGVYKTDDRNALVHQLADSTLI